MEDSITVILTATQIVPDGEPYKPSAPVLAASIKVAVDVPLREELIINADFILSAIKLDRDEPEPIFTVKGLRYIEKALLARQDDQEKIDDKDIDWSKDEDDQIKWSDEKEDFEF